MRDLIEQLQREMKRAALGEVKYHPGTVRLRKQGHVVKSPEGKWERLLRRLK